MVQVSSLHHRLTSCEGPQKSLSKSPFKCIQNNMRHFDKSVLKPNPRLPYREIPHIRSPTQLKRIARISAKPLTRSILKKQGAFSSLVKRRVRFNVHIEEILLSPRTEEDIRQCWYSKQDYASFDEDRKRTVYLFQKANYDVRCLNPLKYTVLGLENYLHGKEHSMIRKMHTVRHVRSVLRQQFDYRCYMNQQQNYRPMDYTDYEPSSFGHFRYGPPCSDYVGGVPHPPPLLVPSSATNSYY